MNEALRRGLRDMGTTKKPGAGFKTAAFDMGSLRIASLDDVSEALALAKGDFARFPELRWCNPLER